jgi:hypothetical protein
VILRRPYALTAFLAPNLLVQFSRQIVVQILGMASPKVCGNLALLPFREICSTMKLLGIFRVSNIRENLRMHMWEFDLCYKNSHNPRMWEFLELKSNYHNPKSGNVKSDPTILRIFF